MQRNEQILIITGCSEAITRTQKLFEVKLGSNRKSDDEIVEACKIFAHATGLAIDNIVIRWETSLL